MKTQMSANMPGAQPDNTELSRFMNNGGGPEPHQGSNPGAQSDPGPKEVGFYDMASGHMGGDDGVQAEAQRPAPMRMGGYEGTPPNAGQRGGQNTNTSGAQTSAYSSEEEYGAGGYNYQGGIGDAASAGNGRTGARTAAGGDGPMGPETRNPVGFASSLDEGMGRSAQSGQPGQPNAIGAAGTERYTGDSGTEGFQGVYQSRAAQMLVDMRQDASVQPAGAAEQQDAKPRVADKAGEVADAVKGKAGGFFSRTRDRVEDFLSVDLNNDGNVGSQHPTRGPSYEDAQRMEPRGFDTREKARAQSHDLDVGGKARMEPQAFETRERAQFGGPADTGVGEDDGLAGDSSFTVFYGEQAGEAMERAEAAGDAGMQAASTSRAQAQTRELVDA